MTSSLRKGEGQIAQILCAESRLGFSCPRRIMIQRMEENSGQALLSTLCMSYIIPIFFVRGGKKMDDKREVSEASSWFGSAWIQETGRRCK